MLYWKLLIENVYVFCINSENKKINDDRDMNCGWSLGWKIGGKKLILVVCIVKIILFCYYFYKFCVYMILWVLGMYKSYLWMLMLMIRIYI